MHGQKKRRKRTIDGNTEIDGLTLAWELTSEPQFSSEPRYIGLCVTVRVADSAHRELIIEFPFPTDNRGVKLFLPQRPPLSEAMVEDAIHQAIAAGWDPDSRGKAFLFQVQPISNRPTTRRPA